MANSKLQCWKLCFAQPRRKNYQSYELIGARGELLAYPSDYGVDEAKMISHFRATLGDSVRLNALEPLVRGRIDMGERVIEFFGQLDHTEVLQINSDLSRDGEDWLRKFKGFKILLNGAQVGYVRLLSNTVA